jgi:hypothetical protein
MIKGTELNIPFLLSGKKIKNIVELPKEMAIRIEIIWRSIFKRSSERLLNILSREYLKDTNVRVMLGVAGILMLTSWLVAVFRFQPSDFLVPVRYNSFLGVTELGNWYDLYYVPGVMTLCVVLNTLLGSVVYKKDKMIGYILLAANIFVSALAMIVVINFSQLVNI